MLVWGVVTLLFGMIFNFLLFELEFETFREDLGPWRFVAVMVTIAGGIVALAGGLMSIRLQVVSRGNKNGQ